MLPLAEQRTIDTPAGAVIGSSYAWNGGQYCAIHTSNGVVGCGIFDLACADAFQMAFAIARGTPDHPLRSPEDLLAARIVGVSQAARQWGIEVGMTGMQAVERFQQTGGADTAAG